MVFLQLLLSNITVYEARTSLSTKTLEIEVRMTL